MSRDDCHCEEALERLQAYLDSELASLDADRLQQHIDDCASCLDQVAYERQIRALLRRSCLEKAPEELRIRVRSQLTVIRATYRTS
ncbi:MAG: mycothiol system anti-sigma-R factor [Beutenbergiaceae bacterium]